MRNFDVKDLLVSIQPGIAPTDRGKKAAASHLQSNFLSLHHGHQLELSGKCIQPSKAVFQDYNVTREGPTKRKLQGAAVDPCPCPSKAPEEAFVGLKADSHSPCSSLNQKSAQTLAELKQMLASMQAAT